MMKWNYKIALASQSPRRAYLLEEANIPFRTISVNVDESWPDHLVSREVPEFLAEKKAKHAIEYSKPGEVILTADSIVTNNDIILEKPQNSDEAREMLHQLSDSTHEVITGVCLMHQAFIELFSETSTVHMGSLSQSEIDHYVNQYKPFDKAGSYAIQEWIGWCRIRWIEGTFANIMGLPTCLLYEKLKEMNILYWE